MRLWVNAEECDVVSPPCLAALLAELGAKADRVVVLVNGELVPAAARGSFVLGEADRVEILTLVGGG